MRETIGATPSVDRLGLDIALPGRSACECSEIWRVAGWTLQFVRLQPNETTSLDQASGTVYLKVIVGVLTSLGLGPFAAPKAVRQTRVEADEVTAGETGSIFAVLIETADVPDALHSMAQLTFGGPMAAVFEWQTFYDRFGGADIFEGVDAHIVPGFHLLDADGTEIVYLHFWTMGTGDDASTHNHSHRPSTRSPAFAEIHWVFHNGTGGGGMYECEEVDSERVPTLMQRGEEHGPFWQIDAETRMPKLRPNGAVEYGWHGWQAGTDDGSTKTYDFVAAFEISPDYAKA